MPWAGGWRRSSRSSACCAAAGRTSWSWTGGAGGYGSTSPATAGTSPRDGARVPSDLADGYLDIRVVEAIALARSRLVAAVLTGTPIWLSTDGEVATAESGFVHGKHPPALVVYRKAGG